MCPPYIYVALLSPSHLISQSPFISPRYICFQCVRIHSMGSISKERRPSVYIRVYREFSCTEQSIYVLDNSHWYMFYSSCFFPNLLPPTLARNAPRIFLTSASRAEVDLITGSLIKKFIYPVILISYRNWRKILFFQESCLREIAGNILLQLFSVHVSKNNFTMFFYINACVRKQHIKIVAHVSWR